MNNKVRIFITCIAMAGLLWLVNHLNRDYTVGVFFNVHYEGLHFEGTGNQDTTLYAEVSGRGFSLIKYYYQKPYDLTLSKSDFKTIKRGDSVYLSVIPDNLRKSVTKTLPAGISLKAIPNDTITFSFISYPSRDVPIKVNLLVSTGNECIVSGPVKIIPRQVRITGPAELINKIDSVNTLPIELNGICDTLRKTVKLSLPSESKIRCNISEIHILVPVSRMVQLETKLHYNITILGQIYDGDVTAEFIAPFGTNEPELNLELKSDIVDDKLVFSVSGPSGYKILRFSPEFIPLEK